MNDKLLQRIRAVYPDGDTDFPVQEQLDSPGIEIRIRRLLATLQPTEHYSAIQWEALSRIGKINRIAITLKEHPAFSVWQSWANPEKLAWIKTHGGFYPVLWVTISRVADYYDYHFNDWHPRGDTGYLDIRMPATNYLLWSQHLQEIEMLLKELGFSYFSTKLARELVPGFTANGYDAIADDDPRWEEEEFEPPAVPARIWDCIWGY